MKRSSLSLAVAIAATATAALAQSIPPAWTAPSEPFRIADNLYYVGSDGLTSLLITTSKGHILIDAPMAENVDQVEANIRKLGFKVEDIEVLLVSHAHFDHAGGLARIKKDSGAILAASAGDKPSLEKGTYVGAETIASLKFAPVKVDKVLKDGESVNLGGVSLTANLTPGHSPGCTTWTFNVKVDGAGRRVLYYCSTSVALNKLAPVEQYKGIVADYRRTFDRLGRMKADIFIAPHGEQFDLAAKRARLKPGAPNPFVDPTELQAVVTASRAAFDKACAQQGCK
ncbi:MAG: subclass B3 metallo-beta-lactamase [Caulobacter sp.]|jgi:metallo-beta-lactamase class B|nr:subclass B3 metallo-beta-lactamase [Caulobacter sp.]